MHKEGLFAYFSGATTARYKTLLRLFVSLDAAYTASYQELTKTQWPEDIIRSFMLWREQVDIKDIETNLQSLGITCLSINDAAYPPLLKQLYDPPFCLFVRGKLSPEALRVSIVGPRKCSRYGKDILNQFIPNLTAHGVEIVSGLAFGIDAAAHTQAIRNNGITIAVLPGGIDDYSIAPQAHVQLARSIIETGALVSEFPPSAEIGPYSFPRRNRIVAALSQCTLVVEASEKSGALITARCATDLGREVCAIPQNITSNTGIGSNKLLREGAHVIQSAEDILNLLDIESTKQQQQARLLLPLISEEESILLLLTEIPIHIDELSEQTQKPTAILSSIISMLELKGYIRHTGSGYYQKTVI